MLNVETIQILENNVYFGSVYITAFLSNAVRKKLTEVQRKYPKIYLAH